MTKSTYASSDSMTGMSTRNDVRVRSSLLAFRAWVPLNNCFVLSKEYPGVEKKKSNLNFEKSLTELQTHIDRLKSLYGSFTYAPVQTSLSKTNPFKFVSIIDGKIIALVWQRAYRCLSDEPCGSR